MNRACFPKEKHQNSQKWTKFMNFLFWPFLWFGLPGRLLTHGPRIVFVMLAFRLAHPSKAPGEVRGWDAGAQLQDVPQDN